MKEPKPPKELKVASFRARLRAIHKWINLNEADQQSHCICITLRVYKKILLVLYIHVVESMQGCVVYFCIVIERKKQTNYNKK